MTEQDKLDRVLTHLDSLHEKIDSMKVRQDAMEEEHKKDRADAAEWKARSDAAEKERKEAEEKEKADAAARIASNPELAQKLAEIERGAGAELSLENKNAFSDAQMRCDAAYQAWNRQAPHALHGESLRDFRIRLLRPLQQHSKVYKDSALDLVGDDAAFRTIEDAIINDAVEASNTTFTPMAPLREIKTRMDSGHIITKFVGDPAVTWAPFMGGATKFGKINRPKQ